MREKCPYTSPTDAEPAPFTPRELITLAAQNYLDAPELTEDITDTLKDDLWNYYYDTENKFYLRSRGVRQAVTSSLGYVADMTFMARTATLLENTGQIGRPTNASSGEYATKFVPRQSGVLHDFMQRLHGHSTMSALACFGSITSGDLEVYKPLFAMRETVYDEFYLAKQAWNTVADKNESMPNRNPMQNWLNGIAENVALTLGVLAHNNTAYAESHSGVTAEHLTANALKNISILQAPTTINRSASAHVHVNARFTKLDQWFLSEGDAKLPYQRMIFYAPESDAPHWIHPTLRKGPWANPGFCAANIPLELPEHLDASIVGRFNSAIFDKSGVDIGLSPERAFTSATIIFAVGALVAQETIDTVVLRDI